jgi:UDP-N-acetylglucosamine 2-epimerase (non-hydrolysing)
LRFPAVLLRNSTERPEAVDKGSIVIGGYTAESLAQSIALAIAFFDGKDHRPADYVDADVSSKVVKIIQGYTSIINKVIWNK